MPETKKEWMVTEPEVSGMMDTLRIETVGYLPRKQDPVDARFGFEGLGIVLKGQGRFRVANGHGSAGSHNFTDGQEEISANGSSGMETGKIFAAESAAFKKDHGKGIPHRQHGGGTGGWSEIEWASFLFD